MDSLQKYISGIHEFEAYPGKVYFVQLGRPNGCLPPEHESKVQRQVVEMLKEAWPDSTFIVYYGDYFDNIMDGHKKFEDVNTYDWSTAIAMREAHKVWMLLLEKRIEHLEGK